MALVLAFCGSAPAHEALEYEHDVRPILTANCGGAGCHINQKTSGVELTDYDTILASRGVQYGGPIVVPGDPDASPLLDKIAGDPPLHGSRMPLGREPLGAIEIQTIREWIEAGAIRTTLLLRGDVDGDGTRNVTDPIRLLDHLFRGGEAPPCAAQADVNADGSLDISDAVSLLLFLFAGAPDPGPVTEAEDRACREAGELSFENIYEKVFARSCAFSSCHSAESRKGDLSLATIDDAWTNLVGAEPFNAAALEAGYLRVDPGRPERSFLLRKLTQPGPGEGNRMPANSPVPLPEGMILAIREWILAGAPREGTIEGVPAISEDAPVPVNRLPRPPPPQNGIQLHLPPYTIGPHSERQVHYFIDRPFLELDQEEIFVERIDIHMLEQSHHFILYRWIAPEDPPPGFREGSFVDVQKLRNVVTSQQSFFSLKLPEGVGIKFRRDEAFDLNSHYINLSGDEPLLGEVYVNIFFADPGSIHTEARTIFDFGGTIFVPPFETTTAQGLFPSGITRASNPGLASRDGRLDRRIEIYALTSHTHRHGKRFTATVIEDFEVLDPPGMVYDNYSWDDPAFTVYDPPLVLEPGQGLLYEATYTYDDPPSPSAPPLRWGPTSEDEMIILLGYFGIPGER